MIEIHWHPSAKELQRWAFTTAAALAVMGACFRFIDWGVFAAMSGMSNVLWGFGAFALVTAGTGTRVGLPAYWLWMGFVWTVGTLLGTLALGVVFYLVVTPLALGGRLVGRDRLALRPGAGASMWRPLPRDPHDPKRQF